MEQPDKTPIDIGGTTLTGISASVLYKLRLKYGRNEPVKIFDPYQMLGLVDEQDVLHFKGDVIGIFNPLTMFGYINENWKSWTMPDRTPAMVSEHFRLTEDEKYYYIHPQGDLGVPPSGNMPKSNGHYFDFIERNSPFSEDELDASLDFGGQFRIYDDKILKMFQAQAEHYQRNTDLAMVLMFQGCSIGSTSLMYGAGMKQVQGIRNLNDWLMAYHLYPQYFKDIFEIQTSAGLKNLELLRQAVGDKPQAVLISSTDFGTQRGPLISQEHFREFIVPYYRRVNDWVHKNTKWKTLYHCCGSMSVFLDDMIDCGVDCINPVQCEAADMDPVMLKEKYGKRIVFWGGGVDSQTTLAFGSPDDVEAQARQRAGIFSPESGFVFSTVHNIQPTAPMENIERLVQVIQEGL